MRQRNMWIGETGRERPAGPISPEVVSDTETIAEPTNDAPVDPDAAIEPLVTVELVTEMGRELGPLGRSGKALDDLVPRTWPRSAR